MLAVFLICAKHAFGTVKVIANQSVSADVVSTTELKNVFFDGRNSFRDGSRVQPVIEKGGLAHQEFVEDYLNQTEDMLQKHYRTLVFTGTGSMPKEVSSDSEMVAYVARTRGAVGYVGAETKTSGVKILTVTRAPNGVERPLLTRVEPAYPETLQQHGIGGIVRLRVSIAANGSVDYVKLLGGNAALAEAASQAVQRWKYASAKTATVMEISIPFEPAER